ncbi:MAG: c-type cytochrome domain-containing protein, partial [Planctomycetota bacterium]
MTRSNIFILMCLASQVFASEDGVDYLRDVKPVLRERCYACHASLKQEGGLRVDTAEFARRGGDSGAAVIAGDAVANSLLFRIN